MPQNLRTLKSRIRTAKNIAQLAKTLEMVSVAKIRKARVLAETVRPYAERITSLGDTAIRAVGPGEFVHPYLTAHEGNRVLLVIGPDKGLCGPLVSNLVRAMFDEDTQDSRLITVGKRMESPAARIAGKRLVASFPVGSRLPEYSLVYDLVLAVNGLILSGQATRLDVLYTRFVSYFTQVPTVDHVLPLVPAHGRARAASRAEARQDMAAAAPEAERPHTIEPDLPGLLQALLPHYLEVRLFDAVIQAYSSEHGARMVAMQNA
ncbi:MAG TPA: FoF1 ATP synthase subunit gamma, partial [Spirochaetia bacterium]|nr:FoF1 ATP synthase subunit gamma [Spirochaetia bacterium]